MRKVERFSVQRVTGDGRCLFRALVFGNLSFLFSPELQTSNCVLSLFVSHS